MPKPLVANHTEMIWKLLLLLLPSYVCSQMLAKEIGTIRLSGGRGRYEGNIQVNVDGTWGFVCDDDFGFPEADAVCRDLGYDHALTFTRNNHFGSNTPEWRRSFPKFWLDRVNCSASTSIRDCSNKGLGIHDCGPIEIAGVECREESSQCDPQQFICRQPSSSSSICLDRSHVCDGNNDCPDDSDEAEELCNDVGVTRLATSTTPTNIPGAALGTVYIKHQRQWGTLCDDFFSFNTSKVLCRSLGYESGWSVPYTKSHLGRGEGKIWFKTVGCYGHEQWISQCPNITNADENCFHNEDISLFCYDQGLEVRVSEGAFSGSGQVEVKLGGQWGSVCATRFDDLDAKVVCKMLGYHGDARASVWTGRASRPVWQVILDCMGHEDYLDQCRVKFSNDTCPLTYTAAVTCSHTSSMEVALQALQGEDCGKTEDPAQHFLTRLAKVRGGTFNSRYDAPWLATLYRMETRKLSCGATIISEYYILTVAHCLEILGQLHLVVRVGDYNANFKEQEEDEYFIDKIWRHEEFEVLHTFEHDIALLKVEAKDGRGIRFGSRVRPVCLPSQGDQYQHLQDCTVAGWGQIDDQGSTSTRPREGSISLWDNWDCEKLYGGPLNNMTSTFTCVGNERRHINTCQGDSGGPVTCQAKGSHHQGPKVVYGLISSGVSCERWAFETATRVSKYLGWIYDKIYN